MITTAGLCGAVNALHDSLAGLGGISLINIQLGEIMRSGRSSNTHAMNTNNLIPLRSLRPRKP